MAEKGILHMIYCLSEDFVFKCWVICQTQLCTAASHDCRRNLAGHFTVSKRGWNAGSGPHSARLFHFISTSAFLHFSSLWWTFLWTTICVESKTCHTFPPKPFVPHSYINRKNLQHLLCMSGSFRASQKVNIRNNWHPKNNARVWSLSRLLQFMKTVLSDALL